MDMMLNGKEVIAAAKETLAIKLNDTVFLASCLPKVLEVKEQSPEKTIVIQETGFTFAKGKLTLTISRLADNKVRFESKAMGGASVVDVSFSTADQEVAWSAEINLTGILKLVPKGLIEGAARKIILDIMDGVREKINL
jgi:carbon monoxide dehydrogenase subunit G